MELNSFTLLSLYPTRRHLHYPLNRGLGVPKNQSEGFREAETLAPAWFRTAFSCLSNQFYNPHTKSASQAVYTSLRSILILYFYVWICLQNNTFRSEILAEKLDAFLLHSNRGMWQIISYLHRLHNLNISHTDFVFINMQHSTLSFIFFPPFNKILSFTRCSRALPLCLHTSFYWPAKHTILFPSLSLEYVCDSLRYIITKDNTPRPPLHFSPQPRCSLSQNMFVAAVLVWLPLLSHHVNFSSVMILLENTEPLLENEIHSVNPSR
jgi:hypothetical protein